MYEPDANIALRLFKEGAVLINIKDGFELKHHEMNPGAPRSPIKFNLRPPGTKGGKVSKGLFKKIGFEMARIASQHPKSPRVLIGVPNAGDVLVDSMREHGHVFEKRRTFARVRLKKHEGMGVRRVNGLLDFEGCFPGGDMNIAWMVDDLISGATSKVEALDISIAASFKVPICLVVIDREQGGEQELKKYGTELISLFKMSWLMELYKDKGFVTTEQCDQVMNYARENKLT